MTTKDDEQNIGSNRVNLEIRVVEVVDIVVVVSQQGG
jgi:hypothetical protein